MDPKNDQKNGQKRLKILSKKMIKNDQTNVPTMTQKNEQKWGPKIDFFGDLSSILKEWYQIDSFPRVSQWSAGRPAVQFTFVSALLFTNARFACKKFWKLEELGSWRFQKFGSVVGCWTQLTRYLQSTSLPRLLHKNVFC